MDKPLRKILIIRPDALGDVILTFPLINALKKHVPDAEIVYLAGSYTQVLIMKHPAVSGVILDSLEKGQRKKSFLKLLKQIKAQHFDAVFHCYNELPYAVLCWLAKIPLRVGDSAKLAPRWFHNRKIRQPIGSLAAHEVDINLSLLSGIGLSVPKEGDFGLKKVTFTESTEQLKELKKPYAVLHPGLGSGNLTWPAEAYRELISKIASDQFFIVLTGTQKEVERNRRIAAGQSHVVDLSGKTSMLELAEIIRKCELYISVDTGPMHLAAALNRPVVAISPTKFVKPTRWGPYTKRQQVVTARQVCQKQCFPYRCRTRECLAELSVDHVLNGVRAVTTTIDWTWKDVKKHWLNTCMSVLNLTDQQLTQGEPIGRHFTKHDITGSLRRFVIKRDIQYIVVEKPGLYLRIVALICALRMSDPPRVLTPQAFHQEIQEMLEYGGEH